MQAEQRGIADVLLPGPVFMPPAELPPIPTYESSSPRRKPHDPIGIYELFVLMPDLTQFSMETQEMAKKGSDVGISLLMAFSL
ncbi:unnamed protein product [Gongylonema pulchrum]|uniref:Uncharacterized protein n=1 Tax=Gongylonema pulchrum TaxID=637853 RepID=A0A183EX24_9BILA|nr:unnamed protein product [Gongylonema pulchrum]